MFARWWAIALFGTIIINTCTLSGFVAHANDATPKQAASLDVNPSTVEGRMLSLADPILVQVRLKAAGNDLCDIALSAFSNDDIAATVEQMPAAADLAKLPENAERIWMLRLVGANSHALEPRARAVNITVAFKDGKDPSRQHYLFQSIKIAAPAQNVAASLDVSPTSIDGRTVSTAEPLHVRVRLKAGSEELSDVVMSLFSNDGITTTIDGPPSIAGGGQLAANAEHTWMLELKPSKDKVLAPETLSANVTLSFKEGKEAQRQRYLFQTVKITPPSAATTPGLADIDIKGSLDALSHERPRQLFVVVTNKSSQVLNLTDARIHGPNSIDIEGPGAKDFQNPADSELPYGGTKLLTYSVTPADQVVPGKYPLVVVVSVAAPDGTTSVIAKTQDIELAVLGESDFLGKIGVPSLLFLPGVLFLFTWQLLWSFGKPQPQRDAYPLAATTGNFWVVAVALSIIFAFAYPKMISYLGMVSFLEKVFHFNTAHRDYLSGYGLRDYLYTFAITMLWACVFYLGWLVLKWLAHLGDAWWLWWITPNINDTPQSILRKLGRLRRTTLLKQAHLAGGNAAERVFILDAWPETDQLWIIPPAVLQPGNGAPEAALDIVQRIQEGRLTDASEILKQLKSGLRWWRPTKWWSIDWRPVANVTRPRKVPTAQWTQLQDEGRFVIVP